MYFSDRMAEIIKEELDVEEILPSSPEEDTCTEETEITGKLKKGWLNKKSMKRLRPRALNPRARAIKKKFK